MTLMDLPQIVSSLLARIQEAAPAAGFTSGEAAAQPAVVARGFRFLVGAYTLIWVILAAYLLSLSVRLRRLSQTVRRLKERIGP